MGEKTGKKRGEERESGRKREREREREITGEREHSTSKTEILEDISIRSIWTYQLVLATIQPYK